MGWNDVLKMSTRSFSAFILLSPRCEYVVAGFHFYISIKSLAAFVVALAVDTKGTLVC